MLNKLSEQISRHNFKAFLWHGVWLALAQSFMDVDTVIPAMILSAGGTSIHVGVLSAIMIGGANFTQLFFAPMISNKPYKKPYLILGISLRIISLIALSVLLYFSSKYNGYYIIWIIFAIMTIFSFGGSYANISYTDILGKSIGKKLRKKYFSIKQVINGAGVLLSAFFVAKLISSSEFPLNYSIMFMIGGVSLLVASFGFWNIKETIFSKISIKNAKHFLSIMKTEIRKNEKLKYFLGFVNTQGIAISILPFIIYYSKTVFKTGNTEVGTYLIYKVIGIVILGVGVLFLSKFAKYKYLLRINILLSLSIPLMILLTTEQYILNYIFLIGGIVFSIYAISMKGILLEISNDDNRAIYTGITGAGNILPLLFPLLGGWIISRLNFNVFLIIYIIIIMSSYYFVVRLNCKK